MTNQLAGIHSTTRRNDHSLKLVTTNGYTLCLSANAFDAASWVGSDAAADVASLVRQINAAPFRYDGLFDEIRTAFLADCLNGVEGEDAIRAWTEYATEIADAAIRQAPDEHVGEA